MAHAQLDDLYADHPKVAALSDAAFRLHTAGILYCNRHLTDGLIAGDEVPRLVRKFRRTALAELTAPSCGLWCDVLGGAYLIHDYLDWNPSRAEVEARRAAAAKRKRKWQERQEEHQ